MSNVIAAIAVLIAFLAWLSAERSRKAAEREATAAEASNDLSKRADKTATAANKLSAESNAIARQAAQETRAMYQLQEAQAHEQSRPEISLEVGALPPGEGLLVVRLWSDTTFDSGTLTLAREFMPHPFSGFMAGPDQPEQYEITPSTELPATRAGEAITRQLFVRDPKALENAEIRLICELKIADRPPWQYVHRHNFSVW